MMADRELAAHPLNDAIQISTRGQFRQELRIFGAHRLPVGTVHAGVVKIIAIDAPHFIENLRPLGNRIHLDFDRLDLELAFAGRQQFAGG